MMTSPYSFAIFLGLTILLLVFRGRSSMPRIYYWQVVVVLGILAVLTGYFAWRNHDSVRQLKTLIAVPPYEESVYVPRQAEIGTIARLLPAYVPPNFPLTRQETEQVRNDLMSAKDSATFWILKTSSRPDSIREFYENSNHLQGWEITKRSRVHFVLRRQSSTLTIFFLDDFPRPDTAIVYMFRETGEPGR